MSSFVYQHPLWKCKSGWADSRVPFQKCKILQNLSLRQASSRPPSGNPSEAFQIKAGKRDELQPGLI
jgi:hypothetical protein